MRAVARSVVAAAAFGWLPARHPEVVLLSGLGVLGVALVMICLTAPPFPTMLPAAAAVIAVVAGRAHPRVRP